MITSVLYKYKGTWFKPSIGKTIHKLLISQYITYTYQRTLFTSLYTILYLSSSSCPSITSTSAPPMSTSRIPVALDPSLSLSSFNGL